MKSFERFCTHSMLICATLVALGPLLIAGWLPPLPASMSPEEVKALFDADRWPIRIGMTFLGFSGVFYILFGSAISTQMQRMGSHHRSLARIQFVMAAGTGLLISFLGFLGLALAYRDTTDPSVLQLGHDLWWLLFVGWYPPALWQYITIAWAIFTDRKARVYPRWVAYLNLWVGISLTPGLYIAFFHNGPFAWHGIFGFWLVAIGFFGWATVMWFQTLRAIAKWDIEETD